jgi:hypothetical protein
MPEPEQISQFTIEEFQQLWNKSETPKYLTPEDIGKINDAITNRDLELLTKLYDIFKKEQASYETINADLSQATIEILKDLQREVTITGNRLFKERVQKTEEQDKQDADQFLNNL